MPDIVNPRMDRLADDLVALLPLRKDAYAKIIGEGRHLSRSSWQQFYAQNVAVFSAPLTPRLHCDAVPCRLLEVAPKIGPVVKLCYYGGYGCEAFFVNVDSESWVITQNRHEQDRQRQAPL